MSLKYRDSQGTETPVAGLNGTSGELVPSAALQQSGTESVTVPAGSYAGATITLSPAMPDTDYIIQVQIGTAGDTCVVSNIWDKTAESFKFRVHNYGTEEANCTVNWAAFKLMTDTVHEADAAAIAQNTLNFAPAFSESTAYSVGQYVTYAGKVYKCTTAHSAGAWNASHFGVTAVSNELLRAYDRLKPKRWTTSISIGTSTWGVTITRSVDMVHVKLRCGAAGTATAGANVAFPNAPAWCMVKDAISLLTTSGATLDLGTNNAITYWGGELNLNSEWNGAALAYDADV